MEDVEIYDSEVIGIMVDGGEKLCDYAITKWISYAYASKPPTPEDEKQRQEMISRWKKIKSRIRSLAKELKAKGIPQ